MTSKQLVRELIQDGYFSHHLSFSPKDKYHLFKDVWVRQNTHQQKWMPLYYSQLQHHPRHQILYRGIRVPLDFHRHVLHHPLPFSTSSSLSFVKDWVTTTFRKDQRSIVLCIYVPKGTHVFSLEMEDEEQEINLPPGEIRLFQTIGEMDEKCTLYSCLYKPYCQEETESFFHSISPL